MKSNSVIIYRSISEQQADEFWNSPAGADTLVSMGIVLGVVVFAAIVYTKLFNKRKR